jgi:hypothetical protein
MRPHSDLEEQLQILEERFSPATSNFRRAIFTHSSFCVHVRTVHYQLYKRAGSFVQPGSTVVHRTVRTGTVFSGSKVQYHRVATLNLQEFE